VATAHGHLLWIEETYKSVVEKIKLLESELQRVKDKYNPDKGNSNLRGNELASIPTFRK
jgi:hypothetical protein